MYNEQEISAIIVARKGSVRIPNKSMLKLNGQTLIERKINQLKKSKYIDRIIFGSDSQEMLTNANNAGAQVVKRPDYYCDQKLATANEMIKNMMQLISTDVVVWAHCTNPLINEVMYDKAIEAYYNNDCDSVLSVVKLQQHLWDTDKKTPLNYNPYGLKHICAKDLPSYYMQDGGIFIQSYKHMKQNSYFFGKNPYLFQLQNQYYLDINTDRDYLLAKAIIQNR